MLLLAVPRRAQQTRSTMALCAATGSSEMKWNLWTGANICLLLLYIDYSRRLL